MHTWSAVDPTWVDRGLDTRPCQTIDYKTGICCFSAMHQSLRSYYHSEDWLALNQDTMPD